MNEKKDGESNLNKSEIEKKFLKLLEDAETNPKLKSGVFNSIANIENAAVLIDLFTVKLFQTEASILVENLDESPFHADLNKEKT